jgi:hypothetical protein
MCVAVWVSVFMVALDLEAAVSGQEKKSRGIAPA